MLIFKAIIGAVFWVLTQLYRTCISDFISLRAMTSRHGHHTARFKGGFSRVFGWEKLSLGAGVKIMDGAVIDAEGGVWIGDGTILSRNVTILSSQHHKHPAPFHPTKRDYRNVIIGNRVWIGQGALILPGTHIGDEAIIAAGAIVQGEIPPGSIFASAKAKEIGRRSDENDPNFDSNRKLV